MVKNLEIVRNKFLFFTILMISFQKHITLKSFKAICCLDQQLLLCKANKLYLYDIAKGSKEFLLKIPFKKKYQRFSFSKKFRRLFRLDINYAYYSEFLSILFVCTGGKIYEIDLESKQIISTFDLPRGSRPLNLTEVRGIKGFEQGMYFGEYFGNSEFNPLHIYKRVGVGDWKIVHTFSANSVCHIHNIIADPYRNCLWVFSGDSNKHAAIWKAEDNFKTVEPLFRGSQDYRTCFGIPLEDRLLYATDSQSVENAVCEIVFNGEKHHLRKVASVEGSVIYGSLFHDCFLGATAVEPDGFNSRLTLRKLVNNKHGAGIKSNNATIFLYDYRNQTFQEIKRNEKDKLPFFLFEFGTMRFPTGMENTNYLIWYNVALKDNDCGTEIYKITN